MSGTSRDGFVGSLSYFIGALAFNVNTIAFLFLPPWTSPGYQWGVPWLSGTVGSVLFTFAAVTEVRHNSSATPRELVSWLSASCI